MNLSENGVGFYRVPPYFRSFFRIIFHGSFYYRFRIKKNPRVPRRRASIPMNQNHLFEEARGTDDVGDSGVFSVMSHFEAFETITSGDDSHVRVLEEVFPELEETKAFGLLIRKAVGTETVPEDCNHFCRGTSIFGTGALDVG